MKPGSALQNQLHRLLSNHAVERDIREFFDQLDAKVSDISSADNASSQLHDLEEDLQIVYSDVDHSRLQQVEIFVDVLYHTRHILPTSSIIGTWFDLLLRRALREPRLASPAVKHARELVLQALENPENSEDKVLSFRRRLVDLFLLDVLNENSGKDILEWAELDEDKRQKNTWWKSNLEEILVHHGLQKPADFMTVLDTCFMSPESRLQILFLLDSFVSHPSFVNVSDVFLSHPLLSSILLSLQVDNSATVCAVELTILVKLLPVAAIKSYPELVKLLPRLFAILGRLLCWQPRRIAKVEENVAYSDLLDSDDKALLADLEKQELSDEMEFIKETHNVKLVIREELHWKTLERTFDISTSSTPVARPYFAFLYYLFPCNLIHFLRKAPTYLEEKGEESPWTAGWEDVLDDLRVRIAGASFLRTYRVHPSILRHDFSSELSDASRWASYDVSKIVGECTMLDANALRLSEQSEVLVKVYEDADDIIVRTGEKIDSSATQIRSGSDIGTITPVRQRKISLQDIITTSIALKSGADINVSERITSWPSILFTSPSTPALPSLSSSSQVAISSSGEIMLPTQINETIAGLQREVLLLRTELNFELWLKRQSIQHIARLHQDRITTGKDEMELQRIRNKLKEYRVQLLESQMTLREHQRGAEKAKQNHDAYTSWASAKINEFRKNEKKASLNEASKEKRDENLAIRLKEQSRLLEEQKSKVFQLETQIKTDSPKIDRLRDYEKRIEQLTEMHRNWSQDILLYNKQSEVLSNMESEKQQMKIRIESYDKAQANLANTLREKDKEIRTLRSELRVSNKGTGGDKKARLDAMSAWGEEREALMKTTSALSKENKNLKEELRERTEQLQAFTELLEANASGVQGLVYKNVLM